MIALTFLQKRLVVESTNLFYSKILNPFSSNRISIRVLDPFSLFHPDIKNTLPIPAEKELAMAHTIPIQDTVVVETNPSNLPFISLRC